MMQVSDCLDLSFYRLHPSFQTKKEWECVRAVYAFLKDSSPRKMLSLEERSLDLFGDEKFLSSDGRGLLFRLKLQSADLFAKRHGEPFVFWIKPGISADAIRRVLIIENLSFFHTARQKLNENCLDLPYDMLIYGEGKRIENSLRFFSDFFPNLDCTFDYVGDLDPEGYSIYARLVQKYPDFSIRAATVLYQKMISHISKVGDVSRDQTWNVRHRDRFLNDLGDEVCKTHLLTLWQTKKRLPQEVLNLENWE
jgi:hypothetical protein